MNASLASSVRPRCASAYPRIRCSTALAQRGRTEEAKEAFTASLDAARSLRYEKAITLDALIWLAGHTGQPADTEVLDARAALFGTLGVAATPTVPFTTRCADPPPERLW